MSRILIAIAACAALPVLAESNTVKGQPGFFQPTPDGNSSISRITPPPPEQLVIPGATAEPLIRNPKLALQPEPPAEERAREAESDMDRAEGEHREALRATAVDDLQKRFATR
jgi:hypothetical protein